MALSENTGNNNFALGSQTMYLSQTASYAIAIGYACGSRIDGSDAIVIGRGAGSGSGFTGSYNTFIGVNVGNASNITGNYNVLIGHSLQLPTLSTSYYIAFGRGSASS